MIFYKGSSQNGQRFHFNSRFEPIREFVLVRRKSMFTLLLMKILNSFV